MLISKFLEKYYRSSNDIMKIIYSYRKNILYENLHDRFRVNFKFISSRDLLLVIFF